MSARRHHPDCTPADTVRMIPTARREHLDGDARRRALLARGEAAVDQTAFVEGFRPPVPGADPVVPPVEFGHLYADDDQ